MSRVRFKNHKKEYTIILCNRNFQNYGQISGVNNESCTINLNSANEISFNVYKYKITPTTDCKNIAMIKQYQDYIWNNLIDRKLIYVKELDEYYEIKSSIEDSSDIIKTVIGTSLCEAELSQIPVYAEINTDEDIKRNDYEKTTFYNKENPNASMLDRLLKDKAPHYTIKHVDKSLWNLYRTFSISGETLYNFFIGECSEQYDCIFQFDTTERGIYVYDALSVCNDCGERGDFTECTKCKSKNVKRFGNDTSIFVDKTNLTDSIHLEIDTDSIKNCFKLECGDDGMTSAVRALNPNGSDYIYVQIQEDENEMPDELKERITEYNNLYDSNTKDYQNTSKRIYDLTDEILYLKSSMMPTIKHADVTAETEASKLTEDALSPIALKNLTESSSLSIVNTAIKNYAKTLVKTGYVKLDIDNDATFQIQETGLGQWCGKFIVTNYSDEDDVVSTPYLTLEINDNFKDFVTQKIEKDITSKTDDNSVFDVLNIKDTNKFKEALTLYSLNRLTSFYDAIKSALEVLASMNQGTENSELYESLYSPYYSKLIACEEEIKIRQASIDSKEIEKNNLLKQQSSIQRELNINTFLGELYPLFCSYRREDVYTNANFISEGKDNSEIFKRAEEFLELATKELKKASVGVCTITADLYDFLQIPQFKSLLDSFELGNRIKISVDGTLYVLSLISYTVQNSDDSQSISVTFSSASKVVNEHTKTDDILSSAQTISRTYSYIQKQASEGVKANEEMNFLLQEGLNSTLIQIKNNDYEEVVYDNHGLTLKSYDDISQDYDEKQAILTHNAFAFTKNNWESVELAFGDFYYVDPKTGERKSAYGINGEVIIGKIILGEDLGIYTKNNNMTFNENGLVVSNGKNTVIINPNSEDGNLFLLKNQSKDIIYMDEEGNGIFNGGIIADNGKIGNWNIEKHNLFAQFSTEVITYEKVPLLDENGEPVYEAVVMVDENANIVYETDENGNFIEEPVLDENGNAVYESYAVLDEYGNPVYDDNGNQMFEYKYETVEVEYELNIIDNDGNVIKSTVIEEELQPIIKKQKVPKTENVIVFVEVEKKSEEKCDNYTILSSIGDIALSVGATLEDSSKYIATAPSPLRGKFKLYNNGELHLPSCYLENDNEPSSLYFLRNIEGVCNVSRIYNDDNSSLVFSFKKENESNECVSVFLNREGLYPYVTNAYSCGDSKNRWKNMYTQVLDVSKNVTFPDVLCMRDDLNRKRQVITLRNDGTHNNGSNLIIGAKGNTFIGSGESALSTYEKYYKNSGAENLFLLSDTSIYFYTNCQQIEKRNGLMIDSSLNVRPLRDAVGNLGTGKHRWNNIYSAHNVTVTSDERLKTDLQNIHKAKELILSLNPIQYRFIRPDADRIHYGFSSQQLKRTLDNLGIENCGVWTADVTDKGLMNGHTLETATEDEKIYGLRYEELIAPMVQAIQDIYKEIENLKRKED